jgi:type IV secretory pathway TraG/TraD family ATPase VirD4
MYFWESAIFLSSKNKGLVLSHNNRLPLEESYKNLCLVAPTGTGKTSTFVIPNILQCEGSMVVTDPAGEIYKKTSGHMKEKGYNIQVLQPTNLDHSIRFNPLVRYKNQQQLRQLAAILNSNVASDKSDPFWTTAALNIIYISLCALSNVEDESCKNIGNLRWILNHLGNTADKGISSFMSKYLDDTAFSEYKAFLHQDNKVIASILSSARASLDLWSDPDIVKLTATDTADIEALRKTKTIFYIIVPEHQVKYFSIIINLFCSACFQYCLENYTADMLPVFFFLDEFGNIGKINNFASIVTTLRKRQCSINIILQEISQLKAIYGHHEAQTIYAGGIGNKLFFSGLDLETCTYLERVLGRSTEYEREEENSRIVGKPLLTSDQIRRLKKSKAVLISGNKRPVKIKMKPFFKHLRLKKLTEKPSYQMKTEYSNETIKYLTFSEELQGVQ